MKPDIGVGFACKSLGDRYGFMVSDYFLSVFDRIPRQVSRFSVGTALEAAGKPDQIGGGHSLSKRILAGAVDFALNSDCGRIDFSLILVDKHAICRCQQ